MPMHLAMRRRQHAISFQSRAHKLLLHFVSPAPALIYCALVAPQAAAAAAAAAPENHFATFASSHDDAGPQSGVNSSRRAD